MSDTFFTAAILLPWLLTASVTGAQASSPSEQELTELKIRVEQLEKLLDERVDRLATAIETQNQVADTRNVHIGGYGELHFNLLEQGDEERRELDFHRFVLFFGYDFSQTIRLFSEFEVEHVIASAGNRGAVELEQAYLEMDLGSHSQLQTGLLLTPLGIINETHEPPTFYGVERPVIETTVIPTTWYVNGINYRYRLDSGWQFDAMISEGLKTEDPTSAADAEPFNLKSGKQKGSFAAAYDLAYTGRLAYTGIPGLNISAYVQYQSDLDQSAKSSYADAATLLGGHLIYQTGDWQLKALVAQWFLDGDEAENAGKEAQFGTYLELAWKPLTRFAVFARHSLWSLEKDIDAQQTDIGLSYFAHKNVVFKLDTQVQNDDAGDVSGINLGMGYQF